jgi:PAS domain S-box-containing protein
MPDISEQDSIVLITNKNGRVDYEINQEAIKNIKDGIIIGDLYGYISDVNEAILKIYDAKDKSELVGRHYLEFLAKDEKARAIESSLASITNNQGMTGQYRIRLKNGAEIKFDVITSFIKDEQGGNIGFIDIIRKPV